MEVMEQRQENVVADPVEALIAVMRPMVVSVVHSITQDVIESAGLDRYQLPIKTIFRMRRESDGDSGNAFEYAIHDAILRQDPVVVGRVVDALVPPQGRILGGRSAKFGLLGSALSFARRRQLSTAILWMNYIREIPRLSLWDRPDASPEPIDHDQGKLAGWDPGTERLSAWQAAC
jgi:hypothetical protein